jgi:hypothetical protein
LRSPIIDGRDRRQVVVHAFVPALGAGAAGRGCSSLILLVLL